MEYDGLIPSPAHNPWQQLIDLIKERPFLYAKPHEKLLKRDTSDQILKIINENGEGMLLSEIANKMHGKRTTIKSALKRLIARGAIKCNRLNIKSKEGFYYAIGMESFPKSIFNKTVYIDGKNSVVWEEKSKLMMMHLRRHDTITQAQYVDLCGVGKATTKDHFQKYLKLGMIEIVSKNPTGFIYRKKK